MSMNAMSVSKAFDVRGLSFAEQVMLLRLAKYEGAPTPPTVQQLADEMGCDRRRVQRLTAELEAKNLYIPKFGTFGGRGKANQYQLTFPNWLEEMYAKNPPRLKPRSRAKLRVVGGRAVNE